MSVLGHVQLERLSSFLQTFKADKTCPITLILPSSQSLLLEYIKGDMESLYSKFALYGSKNESTRTDTVLSEVSEGAVSLGNCLQFLRQLRIINNKVQCYDLDEVRWRSCMQMNNYSDLGGNYLLDTQYKVVGYLHSD